MLLYQQPSFTARVWQNGNFGLHEGQTVYMPIHHANLHTLTFLLSGTLTGTMCMSYSADLSQFILIEIGTWKW